MQPKSTRNMVGSGTMGVISIPGGIGRQQNRDDLKQSQLNGESQWHKWVSVIFKMKIARKILIFYKILLKILVNFLKKQLQAKIFLQNACL